MRGNGTTSVRLFVFLTAALLLPGGAGAHFDNLLASSRTLSLGGAFVAVADDPSASLVNPAGLALTRSQTFLFSLVKPYGIPDLEESYFAAALPVKVGVLGCSWHRFALEGISAEDLFTLAFSRDIIRTTLDASLSFGASIDVARVSYSGRYHESKSVVTGSLGILLRPFPIIGVGYSVRNLGRGTFDLLPGGGVTPLEAVHAFGVSYHWERVSVLFERRANQSREWKNHVGLEVRMPSGFRVRSGLDRGDVTGGVGLLVSRLTVDIGVSSHEVLGTSYMMSVGYSLAGKGGADEPIH